MLRTTLIVAGAALALHASTALADQDPIDSCLGDTNADTLVDVTDLSKIFTSWGLSCAQDCGRSAGDFNEDGSVDVMDLILVIMNWGACVILEPDPDPDPDADAPGPKSDEFVDDFGDGSPDTPGDFNALDKEFSEEVGP